MYHENFDLESVVSPVDYRQLQHLLQETNYNEFETKFLVSGFKEGFSLEYNGPEKVRINAPNLKFRGVGDEVVLWNKIMKEVRVKRYAGPYSSIPFDYYIQSPVGLVPKDGGRDTRLIFHLSHPRGKGSSVNENIPKHLCKVNYPSFDKAIQLCIAAGIGCKISKSDMQSAFRNLGMLPRHWKYLVLKAVSPIDGKTYYFIDKALPFGSSISCSHFQRFSNAVAHLIRVITGNDNVNYLNDYLFVALLQLVCNNQVRTFLKICEQIRFPVSLEKTRWASTCLVFLGILIDTVHQIVAIPIDKIKKASNLLEILIGNGAKKKATVKQTQKLCGFLNFIGCCVVPGRAFTRRLYSICSGNKLKPHHHVRITAEIKKDMQLWKLFLQHSSVFSRPFLDFTGYVCGTEINWYTDASGKIGFGGVCNNTFWMFGEWSRDFLVKCKPSIQYQELYAVTVAILCWIDLFKNKRVVLFCDNEGVVGMLNTTTSSCKNCMILIRIIVLKCLVENVRIYGKHVKSEDNLLADMLSRGKIDYFKRLTKEKFSFQEEPSKLPERIWPVEKIWLK